MRQKDPGSSALAIAGGDAAGFGYYTQRKLGRLLKYGRRPSGEHRRAAVYAEIAQFTARVYTDEELDSAKSRSRKRAVRSREAIRYAQGEILGAGRDSLLPRILGRLRAISRADIADTAHYGEQAARGTVLSGGAEIWLTADDLIGPTFQPARDEFRATRLVVLLRCRPSPRRRWQPVTESGQRLRVRSNGATVQRLRRAVHQGWSAKHQQRQRRHER